MSWQECSLVGPGRERAQPRTDSARREAIAAELAAPAAIHSAERIHRIRIGSLAPVDMLRLTIGGGLAIEQIEVTRADGRTEAFDVTRRIGVAAQMYGDARWGNLYIVLCGAPTPITRVVVRHARGDARFNTRFGVDGRVRGTPLTGTIAFPCDDAHGAPLASVEPVPGYPWGATLEQLRARCEADGGHATSTAPDALDCAPFTLLAGSRAHMQLGGERVRGSE